MAGIGLSIREDHNPLLSSSYQINDNQHNNNNNNNNNRNDNEDDREKLSSFSSSSLTPSLIYRLTIGIATVCLVGFLLLANSNNNNNSKIISNNNNIIDKETLPSLPSFVESTNNNNNNHRNTITVKKNELIDKQNLFTSQLVGKGSGANQLDSFNRFLLSDYDRSRPFSSFLPALGGRYGIPLWAFYVNRGQSLSSFGYRNKDESIEEFRTANLAYQETPWKGFRTIIKGERIINGGSGGGKNNNNNRDHSFVYEPFFPSSSNAEPPKTKRVMKVGLNELEIEEIDDKISGLQTNVLYFTLPSEDFPALIRKTTIKNIDSSPVSITMIDGLAQIVPTGVNDFALKTMGRTLEAFMDVFHLTDDNTVPFYRLRSGIADTEEVTAPTDGNFVIAFIDDTANDGPLTDEQKKRRHADGMYDRLPIIADPSIIFGFDTTLNAPSEKFVSASYEKLLQLQANQSTASRTASGFSLSNFKLGPGESISISSVYGHANNLGHLINHITPLLATPSYITTKYKEAQSLALSLTSAVEFHSNQPLFDASLRQLYLDNGLRGGFPMIIGDGGDQSIETGSTVNTKKVFYTYSRLHGDIERDYNAFIIEPQYYSQGPGNYRDVNQNRRSDVQFDPRVGTFNVRQFLALIQADGYNPLTVQSSSFHIPPSSIWKIASAATAPGPFRNRLCDILGQPQLIPGNLFSQLDQEGLTNALIISREELLSLIAIESEQNIEASYGVGFWTDHWTYNLDQIISYLTIFPDKKNHLLFEEWIPFFYSPATVQPRNRKYVLANGKARQIGAVYWDGEKQAKINSLGNSPERNWQHGRENAKFGVVTVPVVGKLVVLSIVKFASLDPYGMGLEMEGGKPGWLDALNGLPALFGSSMPEAYELLKLFRFLITSLSDFSSRDQIIYFPVETEVLMKSILAALDHWGNDNYFQYWDEVANAKELYRDAVRVSFDGYLARWRAGDLAGVFTRFVGKLESGAERVKQHSIQGIAPTYFMWTMTGYETLSSHDWQGRPFLRAKELKPQPLVLFLEGPVRQMKILTEKMARKELYEKVKKSPLYDRALQMYKISDSVASEPSDIGRIKAFASGWLENESVWTHMSYKYYLELLRGGLYDEFFAEIKTGLIQFMDPNRYGRSPLEVSSFIASSAYSDHDLWGTGFVSRLSGATAEMMSMLLLMSIGPSPFSLDENQKLKLTFSPILSSDFFPSDRPLISFRYLSTVTITYYHPARINTWSTGVRCGEIKVRLNNNQEKNFYGFLPSPYAEMVRENQVKSIDVNLVI